MKKTIILSTLCFAFLGQSALYAKKDLGPDICKTNLVSFISDSYVFEDQKEKKIFVSLNIVQNQENATELLKKIEAKPYDEDSFRELVKIFKNDRNPDKFDKKRKPFDSLAKNKKNLEIMYDSMIWLRSEEAKKQALDLIEMISQNSKLVRDIKTPSYRNFMALKNIGFFKYQTEVEEYFSQIKKVSKKDYPFQMFYELNNGLLSLNSMDPKEAEKLKKGVSKLLTTCHSESALNKYNSVYSSETSLELFVYSKLFPEFKDKLRNLYYASSEKTNIWEVMEFFYLSSQGNNEDAAKIIETVYNLEGKPDYLKRLSVKSLYSASHDSFQYDKFYPSWNYSLKALKISSEINSLESKDLDYVIELKKILKNSASKLISYYTQNHEAENANYIYVTTDTWIKQIFNKKVEEDKDKK